MRLFIAVCLPDEIKLAIAASVAKLQPGFGKASWVAHENYHITLQFLGDVDKEQLPDILLAMEQVCCREPAFPCHMTDFEYFPKRGKARILYVATDQQQRLRRIAEGLNEKLAAAGLREERRERFHSHITLARFKKGAERLPFSADLSRPLRDRGFSVTQLSLMESRLSPGGALYTCQARVPLL